MKKFFSSTLIIALVALGTVFCFAADGPRVYLTSPGGIAGDTVDVVLSISGCDSFSNLAFDITYDNTVLTLLNVSDSVSNSVEHTFIKSDQLTSPQTVEWDSQSIISYNGNLAVFTFKISDNATDFTKIDLSYSAGETGNNVDGVDVNYVYASESGTNTKTSLGLSYYSGGVFAFENLPTVSYTYSQQNTGRIYDTGWKLLSADPGFTAGTEYSPEVTGGHEAYVFGGWESESRVNACEILHAIWYKNSSGYSCGTDYHSLRKVRTKVLDLSYLQNIGSSDQDYLTANDIKLNTDGSGFYNDEEGWYFEKVYEQSYEGHGKWILRLSGCIIDVSSAELSDAIYYGNYCADEEGRYAKIMPAVIIPESKDISVIIEGDTSGSTRIYGPDFNSVYYKKINGSKLDFESLISCGIVFNAETEHDNNLYLNVSESAMHFICEKNDLQISGSGVLFVSGGNVFADITEADEQTDERVISTGIFENGRDTVNLSGSVDAKINGGDVIVSGADAGHALSYAAKHISCESLDRHCEFFGGNVTSTAIGGNSENCSARSYGVRYSINADNIHNEIMLMAGDSFSEIYSVSNAVGMLINISGGISVHSGDDVNNCDNLLDTCVSDYLSKCARINGEPSFLMGTLDSDCVSDDASQSAIDQLWDSMHDSNYAGFAITDSQAKTMYYHKEPVHIGPEASVIHCQAYAFIKIDDMDINTYDYDTCSVYDGNTYSSANIMPIDDLLSNTEFLEQFYENTISAEAIRTSVSAICQKNGYNYFATFYADLSSAAALNLTISIKGYKNGYETTVTNTVTFVPLDIQTDKPYTIICTGFDGYTDYTDIEFKTTPSGFSFDTAVTVSVEYSEANVYCRTGVEGNYSYEYVNCKMTCGAVVFTPRTELYNYRITAVHDQSGTLENDINYEFCADTGVLTVSGTGAVPKYTIYFNGNDFVTNLPWDCIRPNIKKIVISDGITEISNKLFAGSYKLESIELPNSLTAIGSYAFLDTSLAAISVADGNTVFKSVDGVLYSKDGKQLIYYPPAKQDTVFSIPDSVEIVQEFEFSNPYIKTLSIPSNCMFNELKLNELTALEHINVDTNNPYYKSVDDVLFTKNGRVMIAYPYAKDGTEYHIPTGTSILASYSCASANLKNLYIPYSVVKAPDFTVADSCKVIYYEGSETEYASIFKSVDNSLCAHVCTGATPAYQINYLSSDILYYYHGGKGGYVCAPDNHTLTKIKLQVKNNSCNDAVTVYAGVYNIDGQLVECLCKPLSTANGQTEDITFNLDSNAFEIKAFILDSQNKPICNYSIDAADIPWIGKGG